MNTEKFCLKWNDFQENVAGSFQDLKDDFCDVTLASEGNQYIEAHRVILAASSTLLRDMLRKNKHSHPLLYMRKIKAKDLQNIVTFIYHGEVSIFQEDLNDFLSLAEEFELRGLTSSVNPPGEDQEVKTNQIMKNEQSSVFSPLLKVNRPTMTDIIEENEEIRSDSYKSKADSVVPINQLEKYMFSSTGNLNEKIYSLIEKIDGIWTCKVCGQTPARNAPSEIARHAETHLEGVSHTCNQCGTFARSSHALACHVSRVHRL